MNDINFKISLSLVGHIFVLDLHFCFSKDFGLLMGSSGKQRDDGIGT